MVVGPRFVFGGARSERMQGISGRAGREVPYCDRVVPAPLANAVAELNSIPRQRRRHHATAREGSIRYSVQATAIARDSRRRPSPPTRFGTVSLAWTDSVVDVDGAGRRADLASALRCVDSSLCWVTLPATVAQENRRNPRDGERTIVADAWARRETHGVRWSKGRRCLETGCTTLIMIYDERDRCWLHSEAPRRVPLAER
jgi:hypothetical protein